MNDVEYPPESVWTKSILERDKPPPNRLRVLLVEDDRVDRMAVLRHVAAQDLPYDVVESGSIAEARRQLAAEAFDVLVLDHALPDGTGFELLGDFPETPVVFVTGANDLALAVQAVRAGAVDYLVKDTDRNYLRMLPLTIDRAVRERRMRELLQRSRQLCDEVFEVAPIGKVLTSPHGAILKANRLACELVGYDETELVARGWGLILQPRELALYQKGVTDLLAGKMDILRHEAACVDRSGEMLHVQFHVSTVRNDLGEPRVCVVQLQDVTATRRMDRALRTSEAQLRLVLDSMPAAVFACDARGLITYCNPQTEILLGRRPQLADPADRFGASWNICETDGLPVPPERSWMAEAMSERRLVRERELFVEAAPGHRRHVLAYSSPVIESSNAVTGAINILVDVTHLKRLQSQQRMLETKLHHARKMEAIGTLAGGVAHEFNNLLTAIMGYLQLAEMDLPPGNSAGGYLKESMKGARRARDIVKRMLTCSQQAERPKFPSALSAVIAETTELLPASLPPGVSILTHVDESCPLVDCCTDEIGEAIQQLANNSGHAMSGRGGVLEITLTHGIPPAEFRARHPEVTLQHTVCLGVRDTGQGMSAEVLARVFEPFFSTREPGQGLGLGLAGVYGIVTRHQGAVVVESTVGEGTHVRMFFPQSQSALAL